MTLPPAAPTPAPRLLQVSSADHPCFAALCAAESAAFGPAGWSPAQIAAGLSTAPPSGCRAMVLLDQRGAPLGHSLATSIFETWELQRIGVVPGARGCGWGHRLMRDLLQAAGAAAAERIVLEVRATNLAAIALYRAHGLSADGRRAAYYRDGTDAVLMSRTLEAPC